MLLSASHLPAAWLVAAWLLYVPVLGMALYAVPWRRLDNERSHVFFGCCVAVLVLWQIEAVFPQGVSVHLLGATIMALMFGTPLAVLGMSAVVLATLLNDGGPWPGFALNALVGGVLPVATSAAVAALVRRRLPAHLFVFIFATAFAGAVIAVAAVGVTATLLLVGAGVYSPDMAFWHYGFAHLLLTFPEAFITGGAISILVVERPHWVAAYDEARYLEGDG